MAIPSKIVKDEPEYGSDSPTVACDRCGEAKPRHLMILFTVSIGSPGSPALSGFACVDHVACGLSCFEAIAHECVHGHTLEELKNRREKVGI